MPDINLIGTNKKRNITVGLSDEVSQKLYEKCATNGWDVNKLVETFILDLTGNSRGGSRSAEKKANKWFEQSKPKKKQKKPSFLQWLIDEKLMNRYMFFRWDLEGSEALKVAIQQSLERHNPSHVKSNYEDYDNVLSRIREAKEKLNLFVVEYLKVNPSADMEIEIQAVTNWIEQREEFLEGVKKPEINVSQNEPENELEEDEEIDYDLDEELDEELEEQRKEELKAELKEELVPEIKKELLSEWNLKLQKEVMDGLIAELKRDIHTKQEEIAGVEQKIQQKQNVDMKILTASFDEPYMEYLSPILDEEKEVSPKEKRNISDETKETMEQEVPAVREQREDYLVLTVHKQQVERLWDNKYLELDIDACGDDVLIDMDEKEHFSVALEGGILWAESIGEHYKVKLPLFKEDGTENQIELHGKYDEQTGSVKTRMVSVQEVYDRASAQREKIAGLISKMDMLGYKLDDYGNTNFSYWVEKKDVKVEDTIRELFTDRAELLIHGLGFDGWEQVSNFVKEAHELQQTEELVLPRQRGRSR